MKGVSWLAVKAGVFPVWHLSRALEEASHMPILMFLKSRVENAKALRWKEVGHAGGRARRRRGCRWRAGEHPRVGGWSGSNGGARFCTPAVLRISEP